MSSFGAVKATSALGPVFAKKKNRDHYSHELAETSSLTDRVFQDRALGITLPFRDYKFSNPAQAHSVPQASTVVKHYEEMIEEHVERRILFFFQQLIACYQTKLHFETSGAQDQGKSATAIKLNVNGKEQKFAVRQSAHSNTLPFLIAYDKTSYDNYLAGNGTKPAGFVFLKGTDYYRTANSTMNMVKWVNDADREIDEKRTESELRDKTLVLVNRASQGLVTPDEGIIEFLKEALIEIEAAQIRLAEEQIDDKVQHVLVLYKKYFVEFQKSIVGNRLFLEQFLNIKIDPSLGQCGQQAILQIRYKAIRESLLSQSTLIQKVDTLRKEILSTDQRKPDYFDAAFRAVIISVARTDSDRQRLEKLFNFSPFDFEAKMDTTKKKNQFIKTKNLLSQQQIFDKIKSVTRDILHDMRSFRTQEAYQRAQTIKSLRYMKSWQQWRLGNEVKALFPHAAASQSTISRIENRTKLVTAQIAQEFSRVFNVDPGLFMPHFFFE